MQKEIFTNYLKENLKDDFKPYLSIFEDYLEELWSENQKINMVSRKVPKEDYWTLHFLDSILSNNLVNYSGKKVLDFGTGGGLPGIPIKILNQDIELHMLDSRAKKLNSIKKMIKNLDLKDCHLINSRIEEIDYKQYDQYFDIIVCRSVKILPKFKKAMFRILKPNGKIILFKSKNLEDAELFARKNIIDVSHPAIGERKIVEIIK